MKKLILLWTLILMSGICSLTAQVINGSFETPPGLAPTNNYVTVSGTILSNWNITYGNIDLHHRGLNDNGGALEQHIDLNGDGVISQNLTTLAANATYKLSFITRTHRGGNAPGRSASARVQVGTGGSLLSDDWTLNFDMGINDWRINEYTFTTGTNVTSIPLVFKGLSSSWGYFTTQGGQWFTYGGILIDDVKLERIGSCNELINFTRLCNQYTFSLTSNNVTNQHIIWTINGTTVSNNLSFTRTFDPGTYTVCAHYMGTQILDPTHFCCEEVCTTITISPIPVNDTVLTFCPDAGQDRSWWNPCSSFNNPKFRVINTTGGGRVLEYDSDIGIPWNGTIIKGCLGWQFRENESYEIEFLDADGCVIRRLRITVQRANSLILDGPDETYYYCFLTEPHYTYMPSCPNTIPYPMQFNPTNYKLTGNGLNADINLPSSSTYNLTIGTYTLTCWDKNNCIGYRRKIIIKDKLTNIYCRKTLSFPCNSSFNLNTIPPASCESCSNLGSFQRRNGRIIPANGIITDPQDGEIIVKTGFNPNSCTRCIYEVTLKSIPSTFNKQTIWLHPSNRPCSAISYNTIKDLDKGCGLNYTGSFYIEKWNNQGLVSRQFLSTAAGYQSVTLCCDDVYYVRRTVNSNPCCKTQITIDCSPAQPINTDPPGSGSLTHADSLFLMDTTYLHFSDTGGVLPPAAKVIPTDGSKIPLNAINEKLQLLVKPNPTSAIFTLEPANKEVIIYDNLCVLNAQGKTIFQQSLFPSKTEINLSSFSQGVYYIKASYKKNEYKVPLIINR